MTFNGSAIPHYSVNRISLQELKKMVKITSNHLSEKPTWYNIQGTLYYFKERYDVRTFNELFCREFAKVLGLESADYSLAYISERQIGGKKGESRFGLLSRNYQKPDKNYYLANDFMDSQISNMRTYGDYSFENLLRYLYTEFAGISGIDETIQSLVHMYVFDFFTSQTDRNFKNVCFELEADPCKGNSNPQSLYGRTIKNVRLAPMFDNEKSLGIVKTSDGYDLVGSPSKWEPAFPYSSYDYCNFEVDSNILQLYVNNSELALPLIERLAYDDEYRKALEAFQSSMSPIFLDPALRDHLLYFFQEKQKELQRVLKF